MALGLNRDSGRSLAGFEHLRQSIADILTTPKGTRVLRRDYGSDIPALIDRPLNAATLLDCYAAVADALAKWEPRFELTNVAVDDAAQGVAQIALRGLYFHQWPDPASREVEIVL